jgi:hypothetical protein
MGDFRWLSREIERDTEKRYFVGISGVGHHRYLGNVSVFEFFSEPEHMPESGDSLPEPSGKLLRNLVRISEIILEIRYIHCIHVMASSYVLLYQFLSMNV